MTGIMLSIQALSPIHIGTGQGAGVIDLPIIREAVTGWPYLPGSSIKGILRDACTPQTDSAGNDAARTARLKLVKDVFGPATDDDPSEHASGIIVADQRLLCLPVRSYIGGFAWVSSPLAVNRWIRDRNLAGLTGSPSPLSPSSPANDAILLPRGVARPLMHGQHVYLEDLKLAAKEIPEPGEDKVGLAAKTIASEMIADDWQEFFRQRFGVVSDTTFGFLARTAMDVTARNSIDSSRKIVKDGALWWEEAVPAETIFAGLVMATPQGIGRAGSATAMFDLLRDTTSHTLQIGGNATVGRGLAVARFSLEGGAS